MSGPNIASKKWLRDMSDDRGYGADESKTVDSKGTYDAGSKARKVTKGYKMSDTKPAPSKPTKPAPTKPVATKPAPSPVKPRPSLPSKDPVKPKPQQPVVKPKPSVPSQVAPVKKKK